MSGDGVVRHSTIAPPVGRDNAVSQRVRKRVEEIFGWMKTVGGLRKTRYRGHARTQLHASLVAAAYNLLRIARLSPAPA